LTSDGKVWVSAKTGLFLYDQGIWIQVIDMPINCVIRLDDGHILAGGPTGLFVLEKPEQKIGTDIFLKGELTDRIIQAPDGKMWFQSTKGISSYDGIKWTHYQDGVPQKPNKAMAADLKGNVWFARGVGSFSWLASDLLRYDGQELKIVTDTNATGQIYNIVVDHSDSVWVVGDRGRAPRVYDGQKWISYDQGYPTGDFRQWAVGEDAEGKMWVGGAGADGGIYYYESNQWHRSLSFDELGRNDLWTGFEAIFQASSGELFAGAMEGNNRGGGGGIYQYSIDKKWNKVFVSERIYGFHQTMNGHMLAIDEENGLLRRTNGGNWLPVLPVKIDGIKYSEGLGAGFVEQPEGVYWLATNKGLLRIEGDFWYFLSVSDGLPTNNVLTVTKDFRDRVWVGTEFGVTYFTPQRHPHPPVVKLTEIDGENYESEMAEEGNKFIYQTGQPFVLIGWVGGDLQTSDQKMRYQYKLVNSATSQDIWSPLTRESSVNIGLATGSYEFYVRAIDHHFNKSPLVSVNILVKTEAPDPNINFPTNGEVLRGQIYIKGNIIDNDFADYRVFITGANRDKIPTMETEKPIFVADALPRTTTLAIWKTEDFADKDYKIWLLAQDELEHKNSTKVTVRVDNTLPTVEILAPKANQRVLKQVTIFAVTSDINLDSYRLESSIDAGGKSWEQIYLQAGLYQKSEDGLLPKPELKTVQINRDWEIPILEGSVWIRLTTTDIAGNSSSQTIQVEVPAAVQTRKGGTISPQDQQAELYFPPNTLAQDTIVTVNALTEAEVEPPVRRISQIYDFAPATLRLNAIKPATLTISYHPSQLSAGQEPVIFHRTDGPWKAIGGTVNAQQQTISAAVLSLGEYTLGEMDQIQALDSAKLKPDSLTCQPRVFSPKGNAFSTHTTISFTLDQPAQVTIKVYNVAGQLVEWIAQQRTFGSGQQAIRWNGRDSDGEIVTSGLYIVTVTVGDQTQDKVVNVWNH